MPYGHQRNLELFTQRIQSNEYGAYHRHAAKMSAHDDVTQVLRGDIGDPALSFQLRQGFRVLAVVQGYPRHDSESLCHAAVIEWINAQVARAEDCAGRAPRHPPL